MEGQDTTPREALGTTVRRLLDGMDLEEKIGQLCLVNGAEGSIPQWLAEDVAAGRVGGILNEVDPTVACQLQQLALTRPTGLPLLMGRDVIHGFHTVFPIPLGQAASWSADLVEACAAHAAVEAAACGLNWTFAPMLDVARDPRWGRVAESLGEDPLLVSRLGAAMVRGFQGGDLRDPTRLAACAKHFAGYGASEGGRDYNSCPLSERELRQVHFPPFQAALEAGVATVMASFCDVDGLPASANAFLLDQVLRGEWGFRGFVVSDWESVGQLTLHGVAEDEGDAALQAAKAGLDMEMAGSSFRRHLANLVRDGALTLERLDAMVAAVLAVKERLGLLEGLRPLPTEPSPDVGAALAYKAALECAVLLRNEGELLPLRRDAVRTLALLGPLADEAAEQMGTWVFDGEAARSVTPLTALRKWEGPGFQILHHAGLDTTRDLDARHLDDAAALAARADVAVLVLGEEAILSGEAHCRADIRLPGAQEELLRRVAATGTPTVLVLMAGRPLALEGIHDLPHATLCMFHAGNQAGPALRDLLFGVAEPVGKLPVTFPRQSGQLPVHYSHNPTGRPADEGSYTPMAQIPQGAKQHSLGNTSHYLDAGYTPLYPFGHGLGYAHLQLRNLRLDREELKAGERLSITVELVNEGPRAGTETVQLYVRDLVASLSRPVKELKDFCRVCLEAGERMDLHFQLGEEDLRFVGRQQRWISEAGRFQLWVGTSSAAGLEAFFTLA